MFVFERLQKYKKKAGQILFFCLFLPLGNRLVRIGCIMFIVNDIKKLNDE